METRGAVQRSLEEWGGRSTQIFRKELIRENRIGSRLPALERGARVRKKNVESLSGRLFWSWSESLSGSSESLSGNPQELIREPESLSGRPESLSGMELELIRAAE